MIVNLSLQMIHQPTYSAKYASQWPNVLNKWNAVMSTSARSVLMSSKSTLISVQTANKMEKASMTREVSAFTVQYNFQV